MEGTLPGGGSSTALGLAPRPPALAHHRSRPPPLPASLQTRSTRSSSALPPLWCWWTAPARSASASCRSVRQSQPSPSSFCRAVAWSEAVRCHASQQPVPESVLAWECMPAPRLCSPCWMCDVQVESRNDARQQYTLRVSTGMVSSMHARCPPFAQRAVFSVLPGASLSLSPHSPHPCSNPPCAGPLLRVLGLGGRAGRRHAQLPHRPRHRQDPCDALPRRAGRRRAGEGEGACL